MSYNFTQDCPACLQVEDVYPLENNQGKGAYAIFDDAAAMLRHGVKKCCVDCPEKLWALNDNVYFTIDIEFRGRKLLLCLF